MTKRDEYITKAKNQLDELNGQIDDIEAKVKMANGDAKQEYQDQLANVRKQYREAGVKLDELKAVAEDNWDKMVVETDKMLDAFKHSYNYFKSQI
jgi:uncharacterized protein YukE